MNNLDHLSNMCHLSQRTVEKSTQVFQRKKSIITEQQLLINFFKYRIAESKWISDILELSGFW